MVGKFELRKAASGDFSFVLKAGNGQVILQSEQYKSKASAVNGIASVQKNAADGRRFERRTAKSGKPYFVLTATNGQVVGQSEMYESVASMENGIASVQKNAPDAPTTDLT